MTPPGASRGLLRREQLLPHISNYDLRIKHPTIFKRHWLVVGKSGRMLLGYSLNNPTSNNAVSVAGAIFFP